MHAVPPQQVHNLVLNVRSFDSLARQIWGGDAALITLQIDETLIRIDRSRRSPAALVPTIQRRRGTAAGPPRRQRPPPRRERLGPPRHQRPTRRAVSSAAD